MADDKPQRVHKFIATNLGLRAAIVNATSVVAEMQSIQKTFALATMAVGRSMAASLLMAAMSKNEHQVSLYFRGNGPLEMFFAEASYEGQVRGYTVQPQIELPKGCDPVDLRTGIGEGLLTVVKMHPRLGQPHRGTVAIQSGEVAEDIAFYLRQSEQVRSLVVLGVKVGAYGGVESAGGVLVELLPGADQATILQLEKQVSQAGSLSEHLAQGADIEAIKNIYLADIPIRELEHNYPLSYTCRCAKEKLEQALELLGLDEIESILSKGDEVEATCEVCGRHYTLRDDELQELRNRLYKESLN